MHGGIESYAVILNEQRQRLVLSNEAYPHLTCLCVLCHIVQGFLEYPEQRNGLVGIQVQLLIGQGEFAFDPRALLELAHIILDRCRKPEAFLQVRSQLFHSLVHGMYRIRHQSRDVAGLFLEQRFLARQLRCKPGHPHLQGDQQRSHLVMQVACDLRPFVFPQILQVGREALQFLIGLGKLDLGTFLLGDIHRDSEYIDRSVGEHQAVS